VAAEAVRQHGRTNASYSQYATTYCCLSRVCESLWSARAMDCSERSGVKKSRKRRNQPTAKGDQGAASLAGMSEKEKAKIAALDKSDKKGSSLDATTGSAREGALLWLHYIQSISVLHADLPCCVRGVLCVTGSGVAERKEREEREEPTPAPAPQPEQRGKSGKKSKKKKKRVRQHGRTNASYSQYAATYCCLSRVCESTVVRVCDGLQ
jgi:hypothetical protein